MIKPLYDYTEDKYSFIRNIFDNYKIKYDDIDINAVLNDFSSLTRKLGIADKIYLDGSFSWQEESELVDLQLSIEEQYENSWGQFFITWYKDDWKCKSIWYSGNTEDDEQVFKDWENK